MDQKKIGAFLKALRAEKGLTQEQLAERLLVSARTVSRWENGVNLPDLSLLLDVADFYGVGLRELLDGERREETMESTDTKDALLKAAGYSREVNQRITRNLNRVAWLGVAAFALYLALDALGLAETGWTAHAAGFACGAAFGILVGFALLTGPLGAPLRRLKVRALARLRAEQRED